MKSVNELSEMTAPVLRSILKDKYGIVSGISRTCKSELITMISTGESALEKEAKKKATIIILPTEEEKVNKSDILRKEIRRRARADQSLNSGELIVFMKEQYDITMSRQFIVNVRNRYLTACPELLNA